MKSSHNVSLWYLNLKYSAAKFKHVRKWRSTQWRDDTRSILKPCDVVVTSKCLIKLARHTVYCFYTVVSVKLKSVVVSHQNSILELFWKWWTNARDCILCAMWWDVKVPYVRSFSVVCFVHTADHIHQPGFFARDHGRSQQWRTDARASQKIPK